MPVAEINISSKNGGVFYTRKIIIESVLESIIQTIKKNSTSQLILSPSESIPFSEIDIKIERGHLFEYYFKGLHPDGIILGMDLFEQVLNYTPKVTQNTIENELKNIDPNVNIEMLHLLQNISNHVLNEDLENKKTLSTFLFKNPQSPVSNAVARIENLKTGELLDNVKKEISPLKSPESGQSDDCAVCTDSTCYNSLGIDTEAKSTSNLNSTVISNVNSPQSRKSSTFSVHSEVGDNLISDSVIAKFTEIRHSISDVKENLNDIKHQSITGDSHLKHKINNIIPKHAEELKNSLTEISVELENLGKQMEVESKHYAEEIKTRKVVSHKPVYSRALLETRGLLSHTGKIKSKPKLETSQNGNL
jgi:hypothetical protein